MRLLAADTYAPGYLLTDGQYGELFDLEGGNVKLGAAAALETIATSEVLVAKKITTQDLSVDGPAVAEALRKSAALLRSQVAGVDEAAAAEADGFGFDYVDFPVYGGWG
jgi:hypothetical protein